MSRITPGSKESMYVVWSEGKPVTVLKAHRGAYWGSRTSTPNRPKASANPMPGIGPTSGSGGSTPTHIKNLKPLPSIPVQNQQMPVKNVLTSANHVSPGMSNNNPPPPQMQARPNNGHGRLEKEYNALKTREQEDQVELRRLRTENRLLRQRIDNLEKESVVASNASFESQQSQEEKIQDLESRMSSMRAREEEATCTVKELRDKVRELESANRQLQKDPSTEMQQLQEELIACKLREAEATLSMKELRQRVTDLEKYWQKQVEKWNNPPEGTAKPNKDKVKQLQEEVMNVRLREAQAFAELTEMKQKVMELETQNQICNRQIKRLDDENEKLKTQLEEADEKEKELRNKVKEVERNLSDIETKRKEDTMMVRIKDAEHSQTVAEMRQRIAELEIENQELVTAGQLQEKGETEALENRISDLQEEVMQLKISKRLQSISSMALNHMSMETESDYDTDDMDTTVIDTHRNLRMTDSIGSMGNPLADIHKLTLKASDLGPDSSDGEGFNEDEGTLKRRTSKKHKMSSKLPAKSLSANGNKSDNSETSDVPHLIGDRDNSDGTKTEGSSSLSSGDLDKKDMESSVESDDLSSNLDGKSSNNVNGAACDTVSADP